MGVLGAAACGSGETSPAPSPTADRVAEILAARGQVAAPAVELVEAAAAFGMAAERLRLGAVPDPQRRLDEVAGPATTRLAELQGAVGRASSVTVTGESPDAVAVARAWADVVSAAKDVITGGTAVLDVVAETARAELRLEDLVATWNERGSRQEQLDRLRATISEAEAVVADLAPLPEAPGCGEAVARRATAGQAVARHTEELRDLVVAFRGNEFDARRDELTQDPYGLGARFADLDAEEGACWESGATAGAIDRLTAAMAALQAALNPADLASTGDATEAPSDDR